MEMVHRTPDAEGLQAAVDQSPEPLHMPAYKPAGAAMYHDEMANASSFGSETLIHSHPKNHYSYPPQYHHPIRQPPQRTILGLRRTTFFLSLSNLVLAAAAIVLGVLYGLKGTTHDTSTATTGTAGTASPACAANATSSTNSASRSTATATTSSASSHPTVSFFSTTATNQSYGVVTPSCPHVANQMYTVPGTNVTYQRTCGVDYLFNDIAQFPTLTMEDCMAVCAQLNLYPSSYKGPCLGVVWRYDGLQGNDSSWCWTKSNMATVITRSNTEAALVVST